MSSSVVLDNVDDYLTPSNACINPLFQPPTDEAKETQKKNGVVVRQRRRRVRRNVNVNGNRNPVMDNNADDTTSLKPPSPKPKTSAVKASIADCLACSGCVTTAETVLVCVCRL